MKRNTLFSALASFVVVTVLAAYSPFKGTQAEKSQKLRTWWENVVKEKYYSVDFKKFTFKDVKALSPSRDKYAAERSKVLLARIPREERNGKWIAVFDNRNQFCGLLSENKIIADAGRKKEGENEVYVNMFLNTRHLPSAHYIVDNISYYTDELGRIKRVYCPDMRQKSRGRNQMSQKYSVKFKDGVTGDNCGHLIPQSMDGPAEQINFVPQRRDLNSGEILELEKKAMKAAKAGHKVKYDIKIFYHGSEKRPYGFENNVKVYDSGGKLIRNYTGIFDNSPSNSYDKPSQKNYGKPSQKNDKSSRQKNR